MSGSCQGLDKLQIASSVNVLQRLGDRNSGWPCPWRAFGINGRRRVAGFFITWASALAFPRLGGCHGLAAGFFLANGLLAIPAPPEASSENDNEVSAVYVVDCVEDADIEVSSSSR